MLQHLPSAPNLGGAVRATQFSLVPRVTGGAAGSQPWNTTSTDSLHSARVHPNCLPCNRRHQQEQCWQAGNRQEEQVKHPRCEPELPRAKHLCRGRAIRSWDHVLQSTAPQNAAQVMGKQGGTWVSGSCLSRTSSNLLSCV